MILFGLGAGLPLIILGGVSRASLGRVRGALFSFGKIAKVTLGTVFAVLGVLVLTGLDRQIEAAVARRQARCG